ncbi:MAG TPA: serine/threonine-protein kinase [Vicinamibacterales bacterium]|nr:serine/threonine-protein kinase [Vicinamibacterales bacterium]
MAEDLDDLAAALADGDDIDWKAAHARLTSPDSRSVVEGLESLSHISAPIPARARPSRRLPLLLEAARLLSAAYCVVGLAGFARFFERRDAVIVAILATFAGAAAFLDVAGRDRRARALAACFWTTAGAFASRGILELVAGFPGAWLPAALVTLRPDAFFALAVWQFARDFPSITRFGSVDTLCAWGVRAASVIGSVFFAASALPLLLPSSSRAVALAPQRQSGGPAALFFVLLVFGSALAALLVIAWRSRLAEGVERVRVRLFLYAIVISLGPMMTVLVASALIPALWQSLQSPQGFARFAWVVYPPMFLFPIATAYAVAAPDVLNVRLVVQRGLRYVLARWLLMWGALVPLALLLGHLYRHAGLTLGGALATEPAPVLLWFAGVGAIVLAFRGTLIRALDQWALPGVEAPAAALAAMTERMKQARTPLEVATTLADAIERAMQAPAVPYLFIAGAIVPAEGGGPPLPIESAIPPLLEGAREPAIVSPAHRRSYYSLLLHSDREWIDRQQIELLVPLLPRREGGGLLGLVTLSTRRNALGFSDDDIRFVRVAAAAASLACDAIATEGRRDGHVADDAVVEETALQCQRCGQIEGRHTATPACACGGAWQPAALPKQVLSRFELLEWLGTGGMGVVYRASDVPLTRDVALKTLPKLSDGAAERLMTEARTMASLSHEDVAVVYGLEQWRGTPLLVMEYLAGGTLAARLCRGRLPASDVVGLVRQIARSLARVHERGLYHGDIKPSNIGFASGGAPKLLDFGLARALSIDQAPHEHGGGPPRAPLGGTWAYLAPEVRDGAAPGPGLDLWALGVVLCEAWIGVHPFPHARTADDVAAGLAAATLRLRSEHSPVHERLVLAMLSLDPAERPATGAAFERLLADL